MIAYTSHIAIKALIDDTELHEGRRRTVYQAIKTWGNSVPPSRRDLVNATGLPINVICGRVNELLKDGVIQVGPLKEQTSGDKTTMVETLVAVVYQNFQRKQDDPQLDLFSRAA